MDPSPGFPSPRRPPGPPLLAFLLSATLSLAAASAATLLITPPVHWPAWTAGWLTALLNAAIGAFLHHHAIGKDIDRFLYWGFAGNSLRMVALFCSVCAFCYASEGSVRQSFLVAFFGGLLVLTVTEIVALLRTIPGNDIG
jgi:hypothetical protein